MPEDDRATRMTRIVLHPRIAIRGEHPIEKLERLVQVAHRECYIANSVTTEIVIEPEFSFRS